MLSVVAHACHLGNSGKHKIGELWSWLAWTKKKKNKTGAWLMM
jgi:hypothetical protein